MNFLTTSITLLLIYVVESTKVLPDNVAGLSKMEVETTKDFKTELNDTNTEVIKSSILI